MTFVEKKPMKIFSFTFVLVRAVLANSAIQFSIYVEAYLTLGNREETFLNFYPKKLLD